MLHSLFEHNPGEDFSIHFLHRPGIDQQLLARLASLCRTFKAQFFDVRVDRELLNGLPIAGRYTEEAWYRVILPRLLAKIDRVLWLDSDVIVLAEIRELWDTALGQLPLAACPNALLQKHAAGILSMGIADRRLYFNTGVLLLNLERMRGENSERALRDAAIKAEQWIKMADQDVLNCVYHLRWKRLPLVWNVLAHSHINVPETIRVHGRSEYKAAMKAPKIVHFTGPAAMKPWTYRCSHPKRNIYLRHRTLAGWPSPRFTDKSLRSFIARNIPLRPRAILGALFRRDYVELMSYLREW